MAEVQPLKFTIQRSDEPILTALKDALGTYRRSDNMRAGLTIAAPPSMSTRNGRRRKDYHRQG